MLPSYEVAGDWFDIVENLDGMWITLADGWARAPRRRQQRRRPRSLHASRRSGGTPQDALMLMHRS